MRVVRFFSPEPRGFWRPLDRIELPLLRWVERVRLSGGAERATRVLSLSGEHGVAWYFAAAVAARIDRRHGARWTEAGLAVAVSYAASTALKLVVRRGRPPVAALGTSSSLSFPSSHAVTSFAAARMFAHLLPRPLGALAYGAALSMTVSRLHFCVHYPSDLVAGAALGDVAGRATVRRWQRQDRNKAALAAARRG